MKQTRSEIQLIFSQEACRRVLRAEQWVDAPVREVFAFFANPANLARLTPPRQRLRMISPSPPPERMTEGMVVSYSLRVAGIPLRWKARMESISPPDSFKDILLKGPYRSWEHTHRFIPQEGGTLIQDEVHYRTYTCRYGHAWFIRPQLEKIFRARGELLASLFPNRD